MIEPSTNIKFLTVPFSDYNNVMDFSDINLQKSYFSNKVVFQLNDCVYVREGSEIVLKIKRHIDSMRNCNYISYQNTYYSNKIFYAFITKMEYVNPNVTNVYCKMDVFQTFMFDYNLMKSYVERQHVTDYYNTLSDSPSTGKLKTIQSDKFIIKESNVNGGNYFIFFNANPFMEDTTKSNQYECTLGNYSVPCMVLRYHNSWSCSQLIQAISNKGRADRIQSVFYCPISDNLTFNEIEYKDDNDLGTNLEVPMILNSIHTDSFTVSHTVNVGQHFMLLKEMCYPYSEMQVVDSITGKSITLDLCKFANPFQPSFEINVSITNDTCYKIVPINYDGNYYSIENALVVNCKCDLPVFNNAYAKYMKENATGNKISGIMTGASMVGSVLTGNIAGAVSSLGNVANLINQESQAKQLANQVEGLNPDIFDFVNFRHYIDFRIKTMDRCHSQQAINFWNTYGYPIREMTNVLTNTKDKFNFVKTVDCNITSSNIPLEYEKELKMIYDNGVTIWHNENFLNY